MSKNKPKETVEYVLRLQDKERQLLEQIVDTRSFSNVATPIVDLLKDVTGMATFMSILFLVWPRLFLNPATGEYYTIEDIEGAQQNGGLEDYIEGQNILAVALGVAIGVGTGGLGFIPIVLGVLGGTIVAEGGEEIVKDIDRATQSARSAAVYQSRFLLFVLSVAPELLGGDRLEF